MENLNLVKSGVDISEILIEYLAKDAMGTDFLKNYLTNIGEQAKASKIQKEALEKLALSDSALQFEPENSPILCFGLRIGFLGLLHMDIIRERLEREFNLDLVVTKVITL